MNTTVILNQISKYRDALEESFLSGGKSRSQEFIKINTEALLYLNMLEDYYVKLSK